MDGHLLPDGVEADGVIRTREADGEWTAPEPGRVVLCLDGVRWPGGSEPCDAVGALWRRGGLRRVTFADGRVLEIDLRDGPTAAGFDAALDLVVSAARD